MEKVILKATELGLGTCWLGGSLNRDVFGTKTGIQKGEVIPAATPLGYAGDNPRLWEKTVRTVIGANNRKAFGSIFFSDIETVPLEEKADDPFVKVLQSVRIAPSPSSARPGSPGRPERPPRDPPGARTLPLSRHHMATGSNEDTRLM